MRPVSHQLAIIWCTIHTLTILNWAFEHITKFSLGTQVVWPDKINHAPVLQQIVLQRIASQHYPPFGLHAFQSMRDRSMAVFNSVALVTDYQIRSRFNKCIVDFCKNNSFEHLSEPERIYKVLPFQRTFFLLSSSSMSMRLINFFFLLSLSLRKLNNRNNSYPMSKTPPSSRHCRITLILKSMMSSQLFHLFIFTLARAVSVFCASFNTCKLKFLGLVSNSGSAFPFMADSVGIHILNSASQFCRVLIGIIQRI